jgi:hypothetical protein
MAVSTRIFSLKAVSPKVPVIFTRSLFKGMYNLQQLVAYDAIPSPIEADALMDLQGLKRVGLEPSASSSGLEMIPRMPALSVVEIEYGVQHLNVTAALELYPNLTGMFVRPPGEGVTLITPPAGTTAIQQLVMRAIDCSPLLDTLPDSMPLLRTLKLTCATGIDAIDARILPPHSRIEQLSIVAPIAATIDMDALYNAILPLYDIDVPIPVGLDFELGLCNLQHRQPNRLVMECVCYGQALKLGPFLCAPTAWTCPSSSLRLGIVHVCPAAESESQCENNTDIEFCSATLTLVESSSSLQDCLHLFDITVSQGQVASNHGTACDIFAGSLRTNDLAEGSVGITTFRMMRRPNTALIDAIFTLRQRLARPIDVTAVYQITRGAFLGGRASDALPTPINATLPSEFMPSFSSRLAASLAAIETTTTPTTTLRPTISTEAAAKSVRSTKSPVLPIAVTLVVVALVVALFVGLRSTRTPSSNDTLALQLSECITVGKSDVCANHPYLATKGELPLIPR